MKRWMIVLLFGLSGVVFARDVYFGAEPVTIRVPYGKESVFRFPGEVRTITGAERYEIRPTDSEQPSYSLLGISPRFSQGTHQVAFILTDGTIINTRLQSVASGGGNTSDLVYDFKPKDALIENNIASKAVSDIELMRILIRGSEPEGFQVKNVDNLVRPGFKGVETRLIRVYQGDELTGYIFEVTSNSSKPLSINVQNLMLGDPDQAILSNAEPQVIGPKERALLRIVAKPKSRYNKLILPIEVVEKR